MRNICWIAGSAFLWSRRWRAKRIACALANWAMLAAILSTQASTGGNLSESVGNLATMLRERRDNVPRCTHANAESRVTLAILALVPVATVALQWQMQPQTVSVLFGEARYLLA